MSVVGPQTLVDWAAAHENLRLRPSTEIHDPVWLGQNDRFVVILGGLTCDRYGNINSERIGNRIVAGIGGAPDFAKGASLSKGGMCIVAMPAYDRQGMSALREQLPSVSVGRELVTAVVTEYGAAVRTSSESVWQRDLARVLPLHARAAAAT
jgi:acyl-CoA hydrolase